MTIKVEFTEEDVAQLSYQRFHHPHPRVQIKMEALFLKSKGADNETICELVGISPNTLRSYFRQFIEGGVEALKRINFYKPKTELADHADSIEKYFRENPPASVKEAAAVIEELTGIKRSTTQVRKYLLSIGMKFRKVGAVPAKADPDEQEAFLKKT